MMAALGVRPLYRHLMFMNFSMPMSAPKPACTSNKLSGAWQPPARSPYPSLSPKTLGNVACLCLKVRSQSG